MENERFIVSLLQLPKVGRKSAWKVLHAQKEIARSAAELMELVSNTTGMPTVTLAAAAEAWQNSESILEHAASSDIRILSCLSDDFPPWLKSIPDPPLILFLKGDIDCVRTPLSVAVIGTREPSDFGRKVAHRFGLRGAEAGCVIISGLATGCDAEAHRGCLDASGKTIAVLAHGLDRIYPKDNEPLAEDILARGGCWVSEYAPGMRAQRSHFVERDRLQSGLASGVIVVETDVEGGTMHTVRFAEGQGRLLATLSHPQERSTHAKSLGNRLLIDAKRAEPLGRAEDLEKFIDAVRVVASRWTIIAAKAEPQSALKD